MFKRLNTLNTRVSVVSHRAGCTTKLVVMHAPHGRLALANMMLSKVSALVDLRFFEKAIPT